MRKKFYDKNGKKYYVRYAPKGFQDKFESWIFEHIGGCILAVSPDDNGEWLQWPISHFMTARKIKKLKAEALKTYPNENYEESFNKILHDYGLIIR